jgi:hypothetical protein
MKRNLFVGAAALTMALFATPLFAGFATAVTGNGALVPPPVNAQADTSLSYQVWNESQGTLSTTFTVENNGTVGAYNGTNASTMGTPATLTSGTTYGTTMVQLNPGIDGGAGGFHAHTADITFSSKIIGIALVGTSLGNTDIYGAPGTTYPTGYGTPSDNRGIDRGNDSFTISASGTQLEVKFTDNHFSLDEIRVFTAGSGSSSGVPEPASLAVWSLIGVVVAGGSWWRRQRPAV